MANDIPKTKGQYKQTLIQHFLGKPQNTKEKVAYYCKQNIQGVAQLIELTFSAVDNICGFKADEDFPDDINKLFNPTKVPSLTRTFSGALKPSLNAGSSRTGVINVFYPNPIWEAEYLPFRVPVPQRLLDNYFRQVAYFVENWKKLRADLVKAFYSRQTEQVAESIETDTKSLLMEADQVDPRSPEEEEEDDLAYKPGENTVAYIKKLINSDKPIPQETFNSAMQVFDLLLNRVNVISSASDRMLLVALSGTDSQSVVRIEFGGPLFSRGKLVVVYQNSGALRDPENWLSKKIDQMQVYATTDVGTTDIDILPPKEKVDKRASYDVNNSKHANEIIDGKYVKIDITKYGSVAGTGDQLESMKIKVDADGNPLDETGKKIVGADGQPITLAEGEALFALKKVGDKYEIIKLEPSNIESTKATGKNTYVTKYKDEFVEFIRDSHTGDIIKDLVDGIDNTFDSWKKDTITKIPAEEQETFKEFVDNVSKPDVKLCNKIMNVKVNGKYDKNNFFMLKSVDKIAQDVTNGSIFTGYTVVTYEDLQKIIKDLEQTDPDTAKKLSQSVWKSDKTNKIRYILWYRDGKLFLVDNRATLKNIIEKNIPDDFLLDLTGDKKKPEGGDEGGKSEEETNTEEQSSTETQTETPAATPTDTGEPKQEE